MIITSTISCWECETPLALKREEVICPVCDTCFTESEHVCGECGEEITAKTCGDHNGMCGDCLFLFHL